MKKVFALALCAGLLLSGCQGKGQQAAAESGQNTKAANQEGLLTILSQYDNFDPNDPSAPQAEPGRVLAEVTGTEVEYAMLPAENTNEKLYLEVSGGAKYNLIKLRKAQYDVLVSQGALLDMRPYLEEYAPDLMKEGVIGDAFWESVTGPNGELYGVPQKNDSNHITYNLAYRKDILEQYGLPVPKTTQEFYDVVKALAENGIKSPLVSVYPITNGICGAYGIPNTWDDVDGKLVYKGMNPGFFEYADYMKSLYEIGGMGQEPFGTITNKETFPRFASGEAVFMMASWWNTTAFVNDMKALGIDNPEERIGWIQSLTGPDGKKGVFRDKGINYVASIPKYMEETAPEVCRYLNKLASEEVVTKYVLGEENKDYEVKDGKYIPIADSPRQGGRPDWYVLGIPDALWEKYWPSTLYNLPEQYRAWETIQEGAEEFGVYDVMQMAPPLEKWGQAKMVLDEAVNEELILYVNGTASDLSGLEPKLKAEGIDDIIKEVNDWYATYQKQGDK